LQIGLWSFVFDLELRKTKDPKPNANLKFEILNILNLKF